MTNSGIFVYEVWLVKMSFEQSLIARGVTLVTDIFEAIIFIDAKPLDRLTIFLLRKLGIKTYDWIESGLKLALIGPTVYLIKLIVIDLILCEVDCGVAAIALNKVLLAYIISFTLSFFWGAMYQLYLEDLANNIVNKGKKIFCRT
jgi:hypothetical protein